MDLGSDQTSCHNPYSGGYYPVDLSYDEAQQVFIHLESQISKMRNIEKCTRVRSETAKFFSSRHHGHRSSTFMLKFLR